MLQKMIERIVRVVKLDATVYAEIEQDEAANVEAAIIVGVASLLTALGSAIALWVAGHTLGRGLATFFVTLILGVGLNWLLWAYVTMLVGTKLFGGETTFAEMARTLGYANAPRVLGILSAITCLGAIIGFVAWILSLVAGFFAVRESLDLPTDKSIITMVISGVIVFILSFVVALIL
jgi:hypothetical protein